VCVILLALALLTAVGYQSCKPVPCRPRSLLSIPVLGDAPACGGAWYTFDFDTARSGVNTGETALNPTTVGHLHRLWVHHLPQISDSAPILLPNLLWPDGTSRDVLYLTTKIGSLVALDAATGTQLWAQTPYTPSDPNKMTTSSPVGDEARQVVYSYGMDGKVHQYQATTGQEIQDNGWPVQITRMKESEKESSTLNAADGYLYVTTAGFAGDTPPYQGHLVTINLITGATHVFNSLCANQKHLLAPGECQQNDSGIWARAGVVIDPATGHLFVATGNGPYTANQDGGNWGDSVLELSQDGTQLIDAYAPPNVDGMAGQDQDLGSSAPAMLPHIPGSATPYLALQAGKEGVLRLLNRLDLNGRGNLGLTGGELQTLDAPDHCPVLTQPVVWTDPDGGRIWVFEANNCAISGYQVTTSPQGKTTMRIVWTVGASATSPILAGGVLFAATSSNGIIGLDPRTGHQLWSSAEPAAGGNIGWTHWESPIVVGGRLYCSDEQGQISAYGL
jgi:outer membrane protein assembly factor BamB